MQKLCIKDHLSYFNSAVLIILSVTVVMRSIYKDFVLLLQEDRMLTNNELKRKVFLQVVH